MVIHKMSCKKGSFRLFSYLLIICIISVTFIGCGNDILPKNGYRNVSDVVLTSQTLATNSEHELLWDENGKTVILKSLNTGDYWADILYDSFLNGSVSANGNSPISITVTNTKTLKWDTITSYSQIGDNGNIVCKKIENGIRVTYFFDMYKIAVPVDYTLGDDSLNISIDSSKILEDGTDYKLVSVLVAPYFCSVKNSAKNGSVFVPSGCGAIMYSAETADGTRKYIGEVYGRDAGRREPVSLSDTESVRLPVFGAYGDEKGIMGIIKNGAGACEIQAQAGNTRLGYSNVGVNFYVRGYDEFSYVYHGKYQGIASRVNEELSGHKLTVSYYPLYGDEADYNGIAKKYRNYLLDEGLLEKSENKCGAYAVTMLGGTNITTSIFGIPNKKLVSMTNFTEVADIIKDLEKNIGTLPVVRMMGYGDNGIRAGCIAGGKAYSAEYGSKKELKALQELCKDTQLYFDYEIVNFSKSGSGFSRNFDVAKTAITYKAEHFPTNPLRVNDKENTYYIISRRKLAKAAEFAIDKAEKYGIKNVSFSSLGSAAFSDFSSDSAYINKYKMEQDVIEVYNKAKEKGYSTAFADANSYAAGVADVLFDTAINDGDYDAFDLEIPFYQMVFHSYKPMYTTAVNLASNYPLSIAKSAAYGMGLGYTLTKNYIDKSNDLNEFDLYGTVYSDNADGIHKTLIEDKYMEIYASVANSELIEYTVDQYGVSCSKFENGKKIYVNHSDVTVKTDIGELEPYAFLVK